MVILGDNGFGREKTPQWGMQREWLLVRTHVPLLFTAFCLLVNFKEALEDLAQNKRNVLASPAQTIPSPSFTPKPGLPVLPVFLSAGPEKELS